MRTIRLLIEYEGTDYLGWQRQPQGMTVQQALEEAVERITGAMPAVIGAGRTDSGVHAFGQVAHFKTASDLPPERLMAGMNAVLPEDIVVKALSEAPEGFHARFSARGKRYEYTIWNDRVRPVLERRFCWHVQKALDVDAMRDATQHLTGTHDFTAFQSAGAESKTTVRTVSLAEWATDSPRLIFAIEADAFLYNMVRAIVGTLVEIGSGKRAPEEMRAIIQSGDRGMAGPTAPPHGLCLMRVDY